MDTITAEKRSKNMRKIRSKDTKPEMYVRRLIYSMGYRYRLHYKKLPGKPDLVFIGRKKVIFVHGCFWHRHSCSKGSRVPKSNTEYWISKIGKNKECDLKNQKLLNDLGWDFLIIWECEIKKENDLVAKIINFLDA